MPSVADVFMRLRVDQALLRKDIDDALRGVNTQSAGRTAGAQFSTQFGNQLQKTGSQHGQNFLSKVAEGITLRRTLIPTAIAASLAVLPAAFAGAGLAGGVLLGGVLIRELIKVNPKVKAAASSLGKSFIATLNSASNNTGFTAKLVSAIDTIRVKVLPNLGRVFSAVFKALGPLITPATNALITFSGWLAQHINPAISKFTGWVKGLKQPAADLIKNFKDKVWPNIASLLKSLAGNAGNSVRAFGNLLVAVSPLLPALGTMAGIAATLLAKYPKLIPVILGFAGAIKTAGIALSIANIAADANPWVLLGIAVAGAAVLIVKNWGPISRFFSGVWSKVYSGFIRPVASGFLGLGIIVLRGLKIFTDGVLGFFGNIIHGAALAFGWIPGIGGRLRSADAAFGNFRKGVDSKFNGMIGTLQHWQNSLNGSSRTAQQVTARVVGSFNMQSQAASRSRQAVDVLTGAITKNGAGSDQARAARTALISDMTRAGVNAGTARRDVDAYSSAVAHHSATSDQVRAARQRLLNDILGASRNSQAGKRDLSNYTNAVQSNGVQSDAAKQARAKLIADLEKTGLNAQNANRLVNGLTGGIKNIPKNWSSSIKVSASGQWSIAGVSQKVLNSFGGGSASNIRQLANQNARQALGGAGGGLVPGGYAPGVDVMPAMLSPGEFVLVPELARAMGVGKLMGLNRVFSGGRTSKGLKFAGGGFAGNPLNVGGFMDSEERATIAADDSATANALRAALGALASQFTAGTGPGSGPLGRGVSAGTFANGVQLYQYLRANVFHGNKIAAAGATASIWGESTWNPFAQGTGGRGLIGWTPPGTISDAAFRGGMATQLPAIVQFISRNGDWGRIATVGRQPSVSAAAWAWGRLIERFGIPDVHPQGISLATQIMNRFGDGGWVREPVVGVGTRTGQGYMLGERGSEYVASGDDMKALIRRQDKIIALLEQAPARTAAGTARAINAPRGQESQAARQGSR